MLLSESISIVHLLSVTPSMVFFIIHTVKNPKIYQITETESLLL